MTKKSKKNSGKQKVLALAFTAVFLFGFFAVYQVDAYYSNGIASNSIVYESDINAEFPIIPVEDTDLVANEFTQFRTGLYQKITNKYLIYNKTAIYSGNNTWSIGINTTQTSQVLFIQWLFVLPNFDDYVMSDINLTLSKSADPDLRMTISVYSLDNSSIKDDGETGGTGIYIETGMGSMIGTNTFHNVTVPRATGLNLFDKAQDQPIHIMVIQIQDSTNDGLTGFTSDMTVSITGQPIADYNAQSVLTWAIGGAAIMNIIVMLFMTDAIDYGNIKRDLPKKRKSYGFIPLAALGILGLSSIVSAAYDPIGISFYGTRIDIIYIVPLAMLLAVSIGVIYDKLNIWIGALGVVIAFGVSYWLAAYYNMIAIPVSNSIMYGYAWGGFEIAGAIHIISCFGLGIVAISNFYLSRGVKIWA